MSSNGLAEHLAQVPLFAHCSQLELGTVARHAQISEVPEGTEIITEGSPGDAFYVILDGKAHVTREGEQVAEVGPGTYFGELALLDGEPRSATVVADSPLSVATLSRDVFRLVLREFPDLTEQLLASLAGQLRTAARPQ
jgi:CRP/FNR family transcriptional regulator, cyclic AMP receptor protein